MDCESGWWFLFLSSLSLFLPLNHICFTVQLSAKQVQWIYFASPFLLDHCNSSGGLWLSMSPEQLPFCIRDGPLGRLVLICLGQRLPNIEICLFSHNSVPHCWKNSYQRRRWICEFLSPIPLTLFLGCEPLNPRGTTGGHRRLKGKGKDLDVCLYKLHSAHHISMVSNISFLS